MEDEYNKISVIVMWLGSFTYLKMNLGLYKMSKNNIIPAYAEYNYYSETHHKNMTSVKLNYDYYLSIENSIADNRGFFRIRYPEIYLINLLLDRVTRWFVDTQFNGLYFIKNGELNVNSTMNVVEEVPTDQCNLSMVPVIINSEYGQKPGARFTFTRQGNYVDIDSSTIFGMNVFFKRCDLFMMAQSLMNFMQKPPIGTNRTSINPVQSQINHIEVDTKGRGIIGRKIGPKKDDIDQLE